MWAYLLSDRNIKLDPLEDSLVLVMELTRRRRLSRPKGHKARAKIEQMKKELEKSSEWFDQGAKSRVLESINRTLQGFAQSNSRN